MRSLLVLLALSAALFTFGQDTGPHFSEATLRKADASAQQLTDTMALLLHLTADQRARLLDLDREWVRATMEQGREQDPIEREKGMMALGAKHRAALDTLLTPEQLARMNEVGAQLRQRYEPRKQ